MRPEKPQGATILKKPDERPGSIPGIYQNTRNASPNPGMSLLRRASPVVLPQDSSKRNIDMEENN